MSNRSLFVVPMTLREANDFVEQFHRHNGRTSRNGGKFAIGASDGEQLWGVAIVGNPLSATFMNGYTAEVLRVCVRDGAPQNANSKLYAACWRACRAMGYQRLVTYTLRDESGSSLAGAGWKLVAEVKPTDQGWRKKDGLERTWQPVMGQLKYRWERSVE